MIRLSKQHSINISFLIVASFFVTTSLLLYTHKQATQITQSSEKTTLSNNVNNASTTNESFVVLEKFERSETKDGKLLWEVTAQKGVFNPVTKAIDMQDSRMIFYRPNNEKVQIYAKRAAVFMNGAMLDRAHATNGVTITYSNGTELKTDQATYEKATEIISSPGKVEINGIGYYIEAIGLKASVKEQSLNLLSDVRTVITKKK